MGAVANQYARQNGFYALVASLLMLYYGFGPGLWSGFDHGQIYSASFHVFNWVLKGGGLCLLAVAAFSFTGSRLALLFDFLVTGVSGTLMALCAACWTIFERAVDLQNLLVLVFGAMFIRSALGSWSAYGAATRRIDDTAPGRREPASVPKAIAKPTPVHPASVHPKSLPRHGEPPPEEGYLAALAREDEDPPEPSIE